MGHRLTAIEVASWDECYGFPGSKPNSSGFNYICCFQGASYHDRSAVEIYNKVLNTLKHLRPDVVFAPATPFPEGMAAFAYRLYSGNKAIMMDDAWEHTDQRGVLNKEIKRLIHKNIDAAFIPAPCHLPYYVKMGFSEERVVFGIDVVDNDYFLKRSEQARVDDENLRGSKKLPKNYFLFVGRFLPRKGLDTLVKAYGNYWQQSDQNPWNLVLVGGRDYLNNMQNLAKNISGIHFVGPQFGDDLCQYYALARTLVVPSIIDQWGLVVNEGMASGLPVIVSRGCGSAKTLVQEGRNGWTFEPGDDETLTKLMVQASSLSLDCLKEMGRRSQSIVSEWSLDRFVDGVLEAIEIPRRPPAGPISNILTKLWKGRVRVN
jgi:glycosyltransferase involved in cell wall biosynthesis